MRTKNGFKVNEGDARFGEHYKMKGITLNKLDLKISATDTDNDLLVFEQTGLTPNGGPPLHIHPFQDEWFYVIEGEYLFQVGDGKYQMKSGDTIFLPRNVQHAFLQLTERGKMLVSYAIEIQEVPKALTALKYFYENAPEYQIICVPSQCR